MQRFGIIGLLVIGVAVGGCESAETANRVVDHETEEEPAPESTAVPDEAPPMVILPDGEKVEVEIAADDALRAQGLMFRESLAPGKGMIFIFPEEGVHTFWMKNTVIPLDMIWIDEGLEIVHIERDVPPCTGDPCPSYGPSEPVLYVLEIGAGEAERYGLETGDRVRLRNLERVEVR